MRSCSLIYKGMLLCLFITSTQLQAADKNKSLARVAILTYADETGTNNFGYMPNSLTEAIDKSLQRKFEYVREDPAKSETARRKIKASGILNATEAAQYCVKNDVQILVLGQFKYDAAKKQIVVDTYISLGSKENYRALPERRNPTDASIFTLADKVADDIVAEMTKIAKEQQLNAAKATPAQKGEKLELEKQVPVVWAFKDFTANFAVGVASPIDDLKEPYAPAGSIALSAKRLIWRGLYAGVFAQFFKLNSRESQSASFSSSLTAIPLTLNLGYSWFFWSDRWRFDVELGGGYYGGKFAVNSGSNSSGDIYSKTFSNPAGRSAVALHWLFSQNVSFGLEFGSIVLFDKGNDAGRVVNLLLSAGYVF